VVNVRERIVVNKQVSHKFHMEGKDKYRVYVSNGFCSVGIFGCWFGIITVWKTSRDNINVTCSTEDRRY
jgi:hypothetical protein